MQTAARRNLVALSLTACLAVPPAAHAVTYATRVMDANRMGLTVTNYGFVGNNFINRNPSMEYPLGTGYEHLVRGGIWIGASAVDNEGAFLGVSTAAIDGTPGNDPMIGTEYTPTGDEVVLRSASFASPYYSPLGVSDLDAIGEFTDLPSKSTLEGPSRPLSIHVRQTNYSWNTAELGDFILARFVIKNVGSTPLTEVWVGLYTELKSGPKNSYSTWPPSSSGSVYGGWFSKALVAYDEDLRLLREHRCAAQPVPAGCQFEITPAWAGVKLLTAPLPDQSVTVAAWSWGPGSQFRNEDHERYAIMSAGTIANFSADSLQPQTGDPVEVLALGPFDSIVPGDSVTVDFALVGGAEVEDIQAHAAAAQAFHDNVLGVEEELGDLPTGDFALRARQVSNARDGIDVRFTLDREARGEIALFDVAGRVRDRITLSGLGKGAHSLRLGDAQSLEPGMYFVRLAHGGRSANTKVVVAR